MNWKFWFPGIRYGFRNQEHSANILSLPLSATFCEPDSEKQQSKPLILRDPKQNSQDPKIPAYGACLLQRPTSVSITVRTECGF